MALIKNQKVLKLQDSLAENNVTEVLCIKGADTAPKSFMRFHQMDSIERQLEYLFFQEDLDAITFIAEKDVMFLGFAVYAVYSTKDDFKCLYNMKVAGKMYP